MNPLDPKLEDAKLTLLHDLHASSTCDGFSTHGRDVVYRCALPTDAEGRPVQVDCLDLHLTRCKCSQEFAFHPLDGLVVHIILLPGTCSRFPAKGRTARASTTGTRIGMLGQFEGYLWSHAPVGHI